MEYYLQVLAWQNTADGQSKNPKYTPKPIMAPWEKETAKETKTEKKYLTQAELGMDLKEFFSGNFAPVSSVKVGEVFINNEIKNTEEKN
jgi:hypothetical protein